MGHDQLFMPALPQFYGLVGEGFTGFPACDDPICPEVPIALAKLAPDRQERDLGIIDHRQWQDSWWLASPFLSR